MMRAMVVLVLLLVGCSAPAPAEPPHVGDPAANFEQKDEGDEGVDIEVEQGITKGSGRGDLEILVREPSGRALAGAEVDILGTALSNATGEAGSSLFLNLTAKRTTVRVTPAQDYYKIIEVNITVRQDALTRATVTVPVADGLLTPPHQHGDAWARANRVELFSAVHDDFRCAGLQSYCYDDSGQNRYNEFPFDAPVPPGTGRLEVKAEWASPAGSPFALDIRGPGALHLDLVFETSGDTVTLDVLSEETDPPHATLSSWTYQWSPDLTGAQFGIWNPPFVITVTALRGDYELPIDPPHPDHWGERTHIRLADVSDTADPAELYLAATAVNTAPDRTFDEGALVFPGTDRIEFRAWINHTLAHDPPMALWYRPNADEAWSVMTAETPDGVTYAWDVPVVEATWDPTYETRSAWSFRVQAHGQVPPDEGTNRWGVAYDGGFTLHVVATAVKQGS